VGSNPTLSARTLEGKAKGKSRKVKGKRNEAVFLPFYFYLLPYLWRGARVVELAALEML
jgi:hypothetical protein